MKNLSIQIRLYPFDWSLGYYNGNATRWKQIHFKIGPILISFYGIYQPIKLDPITTYAKERK